MLKGQTELRLLLFLGSLIVGIILFNSVFLMQGTILSSKDLFDARSRLEAFSSLLSALSSTSSDTVFYFNLPAGVCSLKVDGEKTTIEISSLKLEQGQNIDIKKIPLTQKIIKPSYISVSEFSINCDKEKSKELLITKAANRISFSEARK